MSSDAIKHTKNIMFIEELANGWKLYGKTGTGYDRNADGSFNKDIQNGWVCWFFRKERENLYFLL